MDKRHIFNIDQEPCGSLAVPYVDRDLWILLFFQKPHHIFMCKEKHTISLRADVNVKRCPFLLCKTKVEHFSLSLLPLQEHYFLLLSFPFLPESTVLAVFLTYTFIITSS